MTDLEMIGEVLGEIRDEIWALREVICKKWDYDCELEYGGSVKVTKCSQSSHQTGGKDGK